MNKFSAVDTLSFPGAFLRLALAMACLCLGSSCVEVQETRNGEVLGPLGPTDAQTAQQAARIIMMRDGETLMGRITGTSMEPVLLDGTIVILRRTPFSDLEPGMDVAYRTAQGEQIVHKLVRRHGRGWVARGINNPRDDPDLVTPENLIGVVYGVFFNQGELKEAGIRPGDF